MTVKRYSVLRFAELYVQEAPDGNYVRYTDYAALEAECGRLKKEIEILNDYAEGGP